MIDPIFFLTTSSGLWNWELANIISCFSDVSDDKADRPPLPKQDAPEEEEAEDVVHQASNSGTGKTVSQTEVPSVSGESGVSEDPEDDRRAGQNVVSEQEDEVEVNTHNFLKLLLL